MTEILSVPVAGTGEFVEYQYGADGRLLRLSCAGREYVRVEHNRRIYDDGFVTINEMTVGLRLVRQVAAGSAFWVEEYAWDGKGRLEHVDGVRIERDERGRVTGCDGPGGAWIYRYRGQHVAEIGVPGSGARRISRGADGRATRIRQTDRLRPLAYDAAGARVDVAPLPSNYHRDEWGRLWTIADQHGTVETTYLWEGYRCIARIDGAPGQPLGAVFSLDPTGTPVRVITRSGVTRIPRDAYGERLLAHQGVPGLYGAVVKNNMHYLAARALDPSTASFTAPDPLDGRDDDPRRQGSYTGPLLVEHPQAGPYAVCQHDPLSRADPTGAFSWWILFADLFWASQNNMTGLMGLDFIFNFWGSLFSGNMKEFFDRTFVYSERVGTWGWRSDGVIGKITGGRAFTYQHQVWSPSSEFDALEEARAFVPKQAFRPALYESMLRGKPKTGDPFLLVGAAHITAPQTINWTRAGGPAEPVVPGSDVPLFPSGGLHFEAPITALVGPIDCALAELEPVGTLHSGNVADRTLVDIPGTSLGLSAPGPLLLTDATKNAFIEAIAAVSAKDGRTRVYFTREIAGLGPNNVRLRGLGAPAAAETMNHTAAAGPEYLDPAGTSQPYVAGDPVRLSQAGAVVGAALIERLEAKLAIDSAFTGLNAPFSIHKASALGVATAGALLPANDMFESASPPNVGDLVLLAAGGTTLIANLVERNGNQCRADRPLQPALGAAGAAITWQRLAVSLTPLGRKESALEADATLVYRAEAVRSAPTADFVVLRDRDGKQDARRITSLTYDAVVLATALPGNTGQPYSVERFPIQAPNADKLTLTRGQSLVLNPPVPDDAVSLYVQQYATSSIRSGADVQVGGSAAQFALNGTTATVAVGASALANADGLKPATVIGLTTGTTTTAALLRRVRARITLDRQLPLAASGLELVPLGPAGWSYVGIPQAVPAGSAAAAIVSVTPHTNVTGADRRVQMPRFRAGEFVEVDYGGGNRRLFRIGTPAGDSVPSIDGMTLGLSDNSAPAALPATVTVQRFQPVAPATPTGSSRVGIRGSAPGGVLSDKVSFDIWAGDGLSTTTNYALVDGATAHPARIASIDMLEIEIAPLGPLANGNYTVAPAIATNVVAAPGFTREEGTIIITQTGLTAQGNRLVLAMPFRESLRRVDGSLSGGTVVVPGDDDDGELTRLDSLIAHELTHTRQWAMVGPLMLFGFPNFILEGIVEAATDVELPEFSPYVAGTIVNEAGSRILQIPQPGATDYNSGDTVQLSWSSVQPGASGPSSVGGAGVPHSVTLGPENPASSNRFRLDAGPTVVPSGVVNVQVRRKRGGTLGWEVTFDILQLISAGGLMNFVGGIVYGGLFNLIGRGAYALGRLIFQQGKTYPGTVEGAGADQGKLVRVTDGDGKEALAGASRVIIEKDDAKLVRAVERIDGEIVRLAEALAVTGDVRIAPYSTHRPDSTFDWYNYFPATIPDESRPATVKVEPFGGDSLSLGVFDRIKIVRGAATFDRTVTAVNGDLVDLNEEIAGTETPFRIAKLGEGDPIGNVDSLLLSNEFGMDWLRWVFDPYGQLQYRVAPDPTSFGGILARIGRYAFGASSWSFIGACVLIIDRVAQAEHLARIEQSASSNSGDTYSPLARLRDEMTVVGDIARFWQVPLGGLRENDVYVLPGGRISDGSWPSGTAGLQDAPGVNLADFPRVMTSLRAATAAEDSGRLNGDVRAVTGVSDRAMDVPDLLFAKDPTDPTVVAASAPNGFMASARARIPTSAAMQRSTGAYVAFSRPGLHRMTIPNGVLGADESREAQKKGRQTTWFDKTIAPVVVSVNGQIVADGDTITLVQTQRARITVTPSGGQRTYAVTLLRPGFGPLLRSPDPNDALVIEAGQTSGTEDMEISRLYRFNTATNRYDHPALARHGMHLPVDLHIPVRLFAVQVVDTLPVRKALTLAPADIVTELALNGDGFVLVPAVIGRQGARVVSATAGGAAVNIAPLQALIQPAPATLPADIQAFVGTGGVLSLKHRPALNITADTVVEIQVEVGSAAPFVQLRVTLTLKP